LERIVDDQIAGLLASVAAVVALAAGYAKAFGAYQCQLVQWVIDAGRVPGRRRGLVNLAVGTALAAAFGALGAWQADDPGILALGLLAGVLASVEAAKVHDAKDQAGVLGKTDPGRVERPGRAGSGSIRRRTVQRKGRRMIPNPNAPKPVVPGLDPEARAKLAAALAQLIAAWPATDDTGVPITDIAEQELISRLRREPPPGMQVEAIDGAVVRELLTTEDRGVRAG
jgi:hypothetical protein